MIFLVPLQNIMELSLVFIEMLKLKIHHFLSAFRQHQT